MYTTAQAKIRNRPIAITDIAISKVPRTRFDGFTDADNAYIQELHKQLLRVAKAECEKYGRIDYECAIVVDLVHHNNELLLGGPGVVDIRNNANTAAKKMILSGPKNTMLYMHNHPSTSIFSADDVKTFLYNESLFVMTAVGNDGSVYVIQKTYRTNGAAFLHDYSILARKYGVANKNNNATLAIRDMLNRARDYGMIYKKGAHKK